VSRLFFDFLDGIFEPRGGTRKIADLPLKDICRHPGHEPANMRVYRPGIYEHVCPGCGSKMHFTVHGATL
jgi:hypothetical protein